MARPTFTVTSRRAPTITWRCAPCHHMATFTCAERFRANSNGKVVEIWLIYRCRRCDNTKNIAVIERMPVRKVPPELLRAANANDAACARHLARDVDLLRRAGAAVADGDAWEVFPPPPAAAAGRAELFRLRLVFPEPLLVRLDTVVAATTGRPRRDLRGQLRLPAGTPRPDALRLWTTTDVELPCRPAGDDPEP